MNAEEHDDVKNGGKRRNNSLNYLLNHPLNNRKQDGFHG